MIQFVTLIVLLRRAKLTTYRLVVAKFRSSEFGAKFQREVFLFFGFTQTFLCRRGERSKDAFMLKTTFAEKTYRYINMASQKLL